MENNNGDWEQKPLSLIINELLQGKELVKQLRSHLDKSSSTTGEYLIEMALGSFDKALLMINQIGASSSDNNNNNNIPQSVGGTNITSPNSTGSTGSPRSDDSCHGGDMYKKRQIYRYNKKTVPQWSKQVKVSSDTGFEGPLEDGYSWRKYGQKAINGATYPRGYYRCTYLHSQGCLARKQVQRSTNPSIFNVTYRGKHTCIQTSHLINQASQSPSKHTFQNQEHPYHNQEQKSSKEVVILNFGTGLSIKTEDLDTQELTINPLSSTFSFPSTSKDEGYMKTVPTATSTDQNTLSPLRKHERSPVLGNYSPTFLSPTSSDQSNYFSEWQQVENKSDQLNEVVSAATSGSSSPIKDMPDLTLDNDPFGFESNFFPFDILDFLS